jgi:3-oxoacyl-[acyl-carrier protein] reductase
MDLGLEGKAALVTGGAAGIGSAIAVALAREGCDVAVLDCSDDTDAVLASIQAAGRTGIALRVDVRDHTSAAPALEEVVAKLGRLDIMVCNAGITADSVIWKMTEGQWDNVLDVNLKGYFNYNQAAARVFKQQQSGKIVNIASINGLRGKFGQANYAASKAGVIALSKTLARELGRYHVNVNVVAPGMVMTDMAKSLPREFVQQAIDETVLGRLADPADCANVVTFLCSEAARHITGQVIQVDGGQNI